LRTFNLLHTRTTATTPPRAREEAAAEALRSLMAEQQLSQTDLLRGLALL
jgi:hypothetical protein